jgi:exodeoxyribonuclease-3
MRLVSFNVNGFRAALRKGFMPWMRETQPDLLFLQEIRCEYEQVEPLARAELEADYDVCWFPSATRKGYAGSATISRKALAFVHQKGLGIPDYDVEGRLIVSRGQGLTLVSGYFPNASDGLVRLPYKRRFARDLAEFVEGCHARGERLVVAGDMNVAPEPIDLARPADNEQSPGFTPEEREDFQLYLRAGLVDVLRERNPGVPGLYTWWSQRGGARERNVGWRIDIFLLHHDLVPRVREAAIHPEVRLSDHCPIRLVLDE